MKKTFRYDTGFARLEIDGLPDYSLNDSDESLSIIFSWRLNLIGFPELEGELEHLRNFIRAVSVYSDNFFIGAGSPTPFFSENISIQPSSNSHILKLISSKPGIDPLEISLDDAELVDLSNCFDALLRDKKVKINLSPIAKRSFLDFFSINKHINYQNLLIPFFGIFTFLTFAILLYVPIDQTDEKIRSTTFDLPSSSDK